MLDGLSEQDRVDLVELIGDAIAEKADGAISERFQAFVEETLGEKGAESLKALAELAAGELGAAAKTAALEQRVEELADEVAAVKADREAIVAEAAAKAEEAAAAAPKSISDDLDGDGKTKPADPGRDAFGRRLREPART